MNGLFKKVDCYMVFVPDIKKGLNFYEKKLGHKLLWEHAGMAGLKMPDSETELVLTTNISQETDLLVEDTENAFKQLIEDGCKAIREPFDIPVGRMAVVLDPFGNTLQFLDLSKREEFNKKL